MKKIISEYGWIIVSIIMISIMITSSVVIVKTLRDGLEEIADMIAEQAPNSPEDGGEGTGDGGNSEPVTVPLEEGAVAADLIDAIETAFDHSKIVLPENSTIDMGAGNLYFLSQALSKDDGTGKTLSVDLNGGKLVSNTKHSNGYYYALNIPDGATVEFYNGSIDISTQIVSSAAIAVETGASLILRNVDVKTNGAAIFPASTASEVIIDGCTIEGNSYAVATNRMESSKVKIALKNSTIKGDSCAVLINCASNTTIENCEVEAGGWAMFLRAGTATVSNTTFTTTDGDVGYNNTYSCSYKNFKYTQNRDGAPYWGTSFQCPYSVVTLGDYSNGDSYSGNVVCTFENVTINSPNKTDIPDVLCAAQMEDKTVTFIYNDASQISNVVIFGEDYDYETNNHPEIVHNGTIIVNGENKAVN